MDNRTRLIFQDLFERELRLLANPICAQCDAPRRQPLLPWLVGPRFTDTAERIVFVGKPHRGVPGDLLPSGLIDPTLMVAEQLWDSQWPYWRYTREIAEQLYGPKAADCIALTNVIKCSTGGAEEGHAPSPDQTTDTMAACCVRKLGVIWKEIERLQARTIVFYTFELYRDLLQTVPVAVPGSLQEVTPQDHLIPCGKKRLGWWERACRTAWTDTLRLLVLGHPERMGRPEFVSSLTQWLRPNPARQGTGYTAAHP